MPGGDISVLFLGWLAFASAAMAPGPNLVAVASRALGSGRAAGWRVVIGIMSGAFIWAIVMSAGMSKVIDSYPDLLDVVGIAGGLYLTWIGLKGLRSAWHYKQGVFNAVVSQGSLSDITHGLVVTLTNPKAGLLWLSLATVMVPAVSDSRQWLVFAVGAAMIAGVIYGGYGFFFSTRHARNLYRGHARLADALFGLVFLGIGIALVVRSI